jgi:hypothetical protein
MEDDANRILDHYERHALSWDAHRRTANWIDQPCIERFLDLLPGDASGRRFGGILAWDSFFHLRHEDQRVMFRILPHMRRRPPS